MQRLYSWWTSKSTKDVLQDALAEVKYFEDWEATVFKLDEEYGFDLWRQNPTSKHYDYRLIYDRLHAIILAVDEDDIPTLVNILRSGLVRNLGNITAPALYTRAYTGTKLLIEDYVSQVALAIKFVVGYDTSPTNDHGITNQIKLDVLHDTRQAFGRSALVLQGGAVFGLCHLGVIRALHLRGLLPRIIVGTAAGAIIAALVGCHAEDELIEIPDKVADYLTNSIKGDGQRDEIVSAAKFSTASMLDKVRTTLNNGITLNVEALERCVDESIGDLTFEEAYTKTRRLLNIIIATSGSSGTPNVLNYLTAPTVLIRSAVKVSNTIDPTLPVTLLCRNELRDVVPWVGLAGASFRPSTATPQRNDRESPLTRIAELFNVNHFIVSQTRPYLAPILRSDLHHSNPRQDSSWGLSWPIFKLVLMEVQHRLHQLDSLNMLPAASRRYLIEEAMPGASLTLVPDISPYDFLRLLEPQSRESIEYWIWRGERSVWPAVTALRVRCAIEVELDRGYQVVRRRKPMDIDLPAISRSQSGMRERARSFGHG